MKIVLEAKKYIEWLKESLVLQITKAIHHSQWKTELDLADTDLLQECEREKLSWQLLVPVPGYWNLSWNVKIMLLKWLIIKGCDLRTSSPYITICTGFYRATRWCSWLRHCATNGRSRVSFPMVSLEFFIDVILLAALWPWGWLSL